MARAEFHDACCPPGELALQAGRGWPWSCAQTRHGRPELATVVLAVIRGLLMNLDATGDRACTERAFADFLTTIDSA